MLQIDRSGCPTRVFLIFRVGLNFKHDTFLLYFKQLEVLNQGKVPRGVSYSPKISSAGTKSSTSVEGSKWSRVRNAFLSKDETVHLMQEETTSMSMPNSPVRNSAIFFAEDEPKAVKGKNMVSFLNRRA